MAGQGQQGLQVAQERLPWESGVPCKCRQDTGQGFQVLLAGHGQPLTPLGDQVAAPLAQPLTDRDLKPRDRRAIGVLDPVEEIGQQLTKTVPVGGHRKPCRVYVFPGKNSSIPGVGFDTLWMGAESVYPIFADCVKQAIVVA